MESTASAPVVVSPQRLLHAFADVPDPRRAESVRYPLTTMLSLAVSALLANHHSVLAIAEWGARQAPDQLQELGFAAGVTPCQSTFPRLFCKLDGAVLGRCLATWFQRVSAPMADQTRPGVAIDGKSQRGRLVFVDDGPVHALSAFCHETGIVLGQVPITVTTDKAEAELTVAPQLLEQVDLHGRVVTGDALFCQRNLCQQVLAAGGTTSSWSRTTSMNSIRPFRSISVPHPPWPDSHEMLGAVPARSTPGMDAAPRCGR